MTTETFRPGDTVTLKSGGPVMTIRSVSDGEGAPTAFCDWFVGNKAESKRFALVQLSKYGGPRV